MTAPSSSPAELARDLLERACADEQAVFRCDASTPVEDIRRLIREGARRSGIHIRTGMVDDTLVVIRADAALWNESTAVMKRKLTPADDRGADR